MAGQIGNALLLNVGGGGPLFFQPIINVRQNGRCDGLTAGLELLHLTEISRNIVLDGFLEQWNKRFAGQQYRHGNLTDITFLEQVHIAMFGNREDETPIDKLLLSAHSFNDWSNMTLGETTQALIRQLEPDDLELRSQCFMKAADILKCTPRPLGSKDNLVSVRSTLVDIVTKCNLSANYIQAISNRFVYGVYLDNVVGGNYNEMIQLRTDTTDQQQEIQQLRDEVEELKKKL